MFECLKEWIILYRSVRRFSEAKAHIHASFVSKNNVYAGWSKHRSVCTQVSGYWSSVYLLSCVSVYCCSALGSKLVSGCHYYILVTTFRKVIIWFSFGWYKGDWLMQIYLMFDWCYWSIQFENLWNVVPVRKEKVVAFCRSAPTY